MRENIGLYKAKRKYNDEWVEGYYICKEDIHFIKSYYIFDINYNAFIEIDPETLCECTELKDKKGKLTWENDIVRYEVDKDYYRNAEIIFKDCQFICIDLFNKIAIQLAYMNYGFEVIGNKFDNKELLGE